MICPKNDIVIVVHVSEGKNSEFGPGFQDGFVEIPSPNCDCGGNVWVSAMRPSVGFVLHDGGRIAEACMNLGSSEQK